jgi:prevent-host-death family protein
MKRVSASDAKNNFGGLLEDVAALGRVEIVRHGRLVAIVLSPRALDELRGPGSPARGSSTWGRTHMIPPDDARTAQVIEAPGDFDDD